jgi:hypothetical protein
VAEYISRGPDEKPPRLAPPPVWEPPPKSPREAFRAALQEGQRRGSLNWRSA